ncbi:hypothetical protein QJS04_geneDACA016057 [Acorus gramineus]|uniref:Dirigent protein n=1 Tax=Acorus gramineus TaxID=55184 RepID=A0AAV9BGE8_ACOGR|nr:hypothetical protein QJS04_geneDACA016057 [Acorus gramineus]
MSLARIIFCTAVSAATLAVILLALVSPVPHRKPRPSNPIHPWMSLSLYVQRPNLTNPTTKATRTANSALIFHHTLTDGPQNTSRVIGRAQGFIIPVEHFAHSAFNIVYLTIDTPEYSGSLSIEGRGVRHVPREELAVAGGTGSFAFARGLAVFAQMDRWTTEALAMYHVKLRLRFPSRSQTIHER